MNLSIISSVITSLFLFELATGNEIRGDACNLPSTFAESSVNSQFRGSLAAWDGNPVSGDVVGISAGHCIVLPSARYSCFITMEIEGKGNILLQGFETSVPNVEATLGIVGGTGCYKGVTGSYSVKANDAFDTFTYTLD